MQFVADLPAVVELTPHAELKEKYALPERYFHLPNQFWAHKNHDLVLEALALLRGQEIQSRYWRRGNTSDHRQPGHFQALMEKARNVGVLDDFRPLGVVPLEDLMGLMHHSMGVVNPSKFEGWSTSVEEAKSMGKAIVLSDIPVHREQAPSRGTYFSLGDRQALATALAQVAAGWNFDYDRRQMADAAHALPLRRRAFAARYQQIVDATLAHHSRVAGWAKPSSGLGR